MSRRNFSFHVRLLLWSMVVLLAALFAARFSFTMRISAQSAQNIITWGGNSPDWDRKLHVTALRLGCSSAPPTCMKEIQQQAAQDHINQIFLSIVLRDAPQSVSDASQFGPLTVPNPEIVEVGFDDFVNRAQKLALAPTPLSSYLTQIARALKSANPRLKFGITLYEDELDGNLPKLGLSPEFLGLVDNVHLYPHYRQQSQAFANYVSKTKSIFPNAQVIAGVYAYDRRDYLPCTKGGGSHCSNEEELSLFKDIFQQEVSLFRSGEVAGLEFYPGSFGMEAQWRNWEQPRICDASRRQECIDNTKTMRQAVLQILGAAGN